MVETTFTSLLNKYIARARLPKIKLTAVRGLIAVLMLGLVFNVAVVPVVQAETKEQKKQLKKIKRKLKKKFNAKKALKSKDRSDRLRAARRLKRKKDFVTTSEIKSALATETDPLVKIRLQQALTSISDSGPETDLIQTLEQDLDAMVRQSAAQKLGNYVQTKFVVKALINALKNDSDKAVHYACALSLGLSKDIRATRALIKASKSSDPVLRRQAAFGLKRHNNELAKKRIEKLKNDDDIDVRKMAGANE